MDRDTEHENILEKCQKKLKSKKEKTETNESV